MIKIVLRVFGISFITILAVVGLLAIFMYGYSVGVQEENVKVIGVKDEEIKTTPIPENGITKTVYVTPKPSVPKTSWGGPELWGAVNKRRIEFGVNPLSKKDELCTIASIRLNQILELGKLDGHEGFAKLPESRPDLKWIFEKYNISEFLVGGAPSASDAVSLWENSLGHRQLLSGGEYVWGCIYAQNSFGVAITAY
jgi:hypothetical protein